MNLSLIELVHLKRIVNNVLIDAEDIRKNESDYVAFNTKIESLNRFFNDCYGIHPSVVMRGYFIYADEGIG